MSRKEMNQIRCIAALTAGFAKKFNLGQRQAYNIFYNPLTYNHIQDQSTGLYYQSPRLFIRLPATGVNNRWLSKVSIFFLYLQQKAKAQADKLYPVLIIKILNYETTKDTYPCFFRYQPYVLHYEQIRCFKDSRHQKIRVCNHNGRYGL